MNLTEYEIRKKYRYSNLSYVFDVYMECEFRANLTDKEYDGLQPGEFRFDYESWMRRLQISKKQLVRAIKELTTKNIVIIQVLKGKRGTSSKYFLARFKEQKKEQNEELNRNLIGTEKGVENTGLSKCLGTEKGTQKEQNEEQKKVQSSQYNNLNIVSNKYNSIFNCWIESNIKNHRALTDSMKKAIDKTLKEYSIDEIQQAIRNYGTMYNDENYQWCDYQWSLNEFILRKDKDGIRQVEMFLNTGSKYLNYLKSKEEINHGTSNMDFC